jgi:hypothetical protein
MHTLGSSSVIGLDAAGAIAHLKQQNIALQLSCASIVRVIDFTDVSLYRLSAYQPSEWGFNVQTTLLDISYIAAEAHRLLFCPAANFVSVAMMVASLKLLEKHPNQVFVVGSQPITYLSKKYYPTVRLSQKIVTVSFVKYTTRIDPNHFVVFANHIYK